MEKKIENRLIPTNFFAINDFSKMENGNFQVKGLLSTFNDANANFNPYIYKSGCYDAFCKNYYEANKKNITVDVLHNTFDFAHLVGKITEFNSNETEASIVCEISKHAIYFNNVVGLIEDGILQGFSDMSYIDKYYFDEESQNMVVEACSIVSVTLTPLPAVAKSQLQALNATKFNFTKKKEEVKKSSFFGL